MTHQELFEQLEALGFPIAYSHFECDEQTKAPDPPFLVYFEFGRSDVIADNKVYVLKTSYALELYTDSKDLEAEQKVEDKLNCLELSFAKDEQYISSERLYQVYYEFEIIGG